MGPSGSHRLSYHWDRQTPQLGGLEKPLLSFNQWVNRAYEKDVAFELGHGEAEGFGHRGQKEAGIPRFHTEAFSVAKK